MLVQSQSIANFPDRGGMFKRRAAPVPPQKEHRQIGSPQLLHTTYDQRLVSTQAGLTASSAPSEYFRTPLDNLSPSSLSYRRFDSTIDTGSVFKPHHQRDNSSVYSQDAQDEPQVQPPTHYSHIVQQSIRPRQAPVITHSLSPPELPTINTPDTTGSLTPDAEGQNKKSYFGTHIPTLRKQKSSETRQVSAETRWDEYRGEPVRTGTGGKLGQVQPRAYEREFAMEPRYDVTITGGPPEKAKKATWGERAAKIRKDTFDARPPWKGGSGRAAIVDPVRDTSVARSSPKFTAVMNTARGLQETDSDNSLSLSISNTSHGFRDLSPVSSLGGRYEDYSTTATRNDSARDFEGNVSPITTDSRNGHAFNNKWTSAPPVRIVHASGQTPSPTNVHRKPIAPPPPQQQIDMTGSAASHPQHWEASQQPESQLDWTSDTHPSANSLTPKGVYDSDEPVSRFSWTTVNTTTTYQQDSPPPSPPPVPVPALDAKTWRGVGVSPSRITAKPPTPPPGENEKRPLAEGPPVSKNMNHVDFLIAQEADLVLRHRTIYRVIKELEKIESASPLDVDWKTVKANKKNLEEKKAQLSVVEREQHELGLAIARARRKAEREDGIESGLWVRKMTG